ncbi:hypothetical protein BH09VER1_BH09VER1_18960 [soil metagenome]
MKQPTFFRRVLCGIFSRGNAPRVQLAVLPTENITITCLGGKAWITMENDCVDYMLTAGHRQMLDATRRPVISVDAGSRIEIQAA